MNLHQQFQNNIKNRFKLFT